jgi:hypothetical protein
LVSGVQCCGFGAGSAKNPELFAGPGYGTRGYGSGSETVLNPYQKLFLKIINLIIMTFKDY